MHIARLILGELYFARLPSFAFVFVDYTFSKSPVFLLQNLASNIDERMSRPSRIMPLEPTPPQQQFSGSFVISEEGKES
jgi:hypothetical protein